jgi:hypothetical protein
MFDVHSSFPYRRVGSQSKLTVHRKHVEHLFIYSFKTDKAKYLVEVELYVDNIYILKFYKRANKNNKERYNLLTNEGRCSRIIGTCFNIFLEIYKSNNLASFGFIGAYTIDHKAKKVEGKDNTKRYRIYTKAMINYFGEETYTYFDAPQQSFYIAVSNKNKNVFKIADSAAAILEDLVL